MAECKIKSIAFENLTFGYEGCEPIFKDVTFNIPVNEVVWVTGAAGSGKSAFLKLLVGLVQPQKGSVKINGEDLTQMSFEDLIPYRQMFGYSFDFGGLINNKTLEQNLLLPLEYHDLWTAAERKDWVIHLLEVFGISQLAHSRPATVPGGVRKAMSVARAFVMKPEVVILDDPTTGLRGRVRETLRDHVIQAREEGHIEHVFVCSEDSDFLTDFKTSSLMVEQQSLKVSDVELGTFWRKAGNQ